MWPNTRQNFSQDNQKVTTKIVRLEPPLLQSTLVLPVHLLKDRITYTTNKAESLRDADRSSVASTLSVVDARALLAREIGSVAGERGIIKTRFAIRHRASHPISLLVSKSHSGGIRGKRNASRIDKSSYIHHMGR